MLNSRKNYLFNAVGFCSNLQKFIELSNIFSHQVEHFYVTYFWRFFGFIIYMFLMRWIKLFSLTVKLAFKISLLSLFEVITFFPFLSCLLWKHINSLYESRISAANADNDAAAVLVNGHFDSPIGSPGAGDCASCVGKWYNWYLVIIYRNGRSSV
mgnify:CR=1 FL=1